MLTFSFVSQISAQEFAQQVKPQKAKWSTNTCDLLQAELATDNEVLYTRVNNSKIVAFVEYKITQNELQVTNIGSWALEQFNHRHAALTLLHQVVNIAYASDEVTKIVAVVQLTNLPDWLCKARVNLFVLAGFHVYNANNANNCMTLYFQKQT